MSRRDQILEVVIDKLMKNSLTSDISLASIAKEVNIGKSTIYEYFSSKEELLKSALFTFIDNTIKTVTIEQDTNFYTFKELFKEQMRRLLEAAALSRVVIETMQPKFAAQFSEEAREEMKSVMEGVRDKIRDRFISFFEKGIEEGVVSSTIDPLDSYMVTNLIVGSIITYSDPRIELELNLVVDKLYETVLKLLQ